MDRRWQIILIFIGYVKNTFNIRFWGPNHVLFKWFAPKKSLFLMDPGLSELLCSWTLWSRSKVDISPLLSLDIGLLLMYHLIVFSGLWNLSCLCGGFDFCLFWPDFGRTSWRSEVFPLLFLTGCLLPWCGLILSLNFNYTFCFSSLICHNQFPLAFLYSSYHVGPSWASWLCYWGFKISSAALALVQVPHAQF